MWNRIGRRLLGIAAACLLACPAGAERGAAPETQEVTLAARSKLPLQAGVDVWVDAEGAPAATVPGVEPGALRRVALLVYRTREDALTWEGLTALFIRHAFLPASPRPEFSVASIPPGDPATLGPDANAEETHVYRGRQADELLVLGLIRNFRTRHQLAYSVLLQGKLNAAQAATQAKSMVHELAERARRLRLGAPPTPTVPVPVGSVPAGVTRRLTGPLIPQLLRSIQTSSMVSPRVKALSQAVISQATAVTLTSWRTPSPLGDQAFFSFYTRQGARLRWGPPIVRDETQSGRPTLMFQRPNGDGILMIRAQPTPIGGTNAGGRPGTNIFILHIEGKIDTAMLAGI